MGTRRIASWTPALGGALLTTLALAAPAWAADKVRLPTVVSYELNLPSLVATANGFYKEENIDLTEFVLGSGGTMRTLLINKEVDFALLAFVHVPLARAKGALLKMVLATHDQEIFSLVVRSELKDKVKAVADLRGLKVGFSTPGAASWALGSLYLRKAGLDPNKDVEFVSLGGDPRVIYTALKTGKVDAFSAWEPTTTRVIDEGIAYPLTRIWEPAEHAKWVGEKALALGLVTREDVIKDKPDLVRRMVRATKKGLDWVRSHSAAEILDAVLKDPRTADQFKGLDRALAVKIIERIKPGFGTGCLSRGGFKVEMDLSVEYQILKAPATFEEFADTTFAGACS